MAFRIRPLHERIFSTPTPVVAEQSSELQEENEEESVFVVDEDTGEIREETINSSSNNRSSSSSNAQPQVQFPELPRKESARVFGLSMKKRTKVSFM